MIRLKSSCMALLLTAALLAGCSSAGQTSGASETDHLARIKAAGKITVATEGAWSPFTYHDENTNELTGFDVEVAREIAKRIGVSAEFAEGDFDGGLTGVTTGTFDMMANGVDVTDDRKDTYDFTHPYAYDHAVVVTLASNDTIASFDVRDHSKDQSQANAKAPSEDSSEDPSEA